MAALDASLRRDRRPAGVRRPDLVGGRIAAYGEISCDEAGKVYALVEAYRSEDGASDAAYDVLVPMLAGRPDAVAALELFRFHARATNEQSLEDAQAGRELAEDIGEELLSAKQRHDKTLKLHTI